MVKKNSIYISSNEINFILQTLKMKLMLFIQEQFQIYLKKKKVLLQKDF